MLKIVIAEDEQFIRKALVYTIDWASLGCCIAAEAEDGQEGLEQILNVQPDLVIADIRMPKLNGIDMIRKALDTLSFESIIITSYEEFDLAKQAIDLQVIDYILKPIDERKLLEAVKRAKEKKLKKQLLQRIAQDREDGTPSLIDLQYILDTNQYKKYVHRALIEIKEHYNQKISVESVSRQLGVSASYLSRQIKAETGLTFLDILHQYRIQKVIEMMKQGDKRLYEISALVGFYDYKHLNSVFKQHVHITPSEFMRRLKQSNSLLDKQDQGKKNKTQEEAQT